VSKFTIQERDFIYNQINARKDYFEEDMQYWAERKNTQEVLRCAKAIEMIDSIMYKLLNNGGTLYDNN
jgi:hypothetical protein